MVDVVVVGSLNMDTVASLEKLPKPGETVHGLDLQKFPGGKGANQATALARLGNKVRLVGMVGQDEDGRILRERLIAEGVDASCVVLNENKRTGSALIVVDQGGNNEIIVFGGANSEVNIQFIDQHREAFAGAKFLLMQFEIPLETVAFLIDLAYENQLPVVINPSPFYPIKERFFHKIDTLVLNETEASSLLGLSISSVTQALKAAESIHHMGIRQIVLTLGGQGAVICDQTGPAEHLPAFPVQPVDTTASGDAFLGGMLHGLLEGKNLKDAVKFANAVGALTVTKMGAQSSLPSLSEVMTFLSNRQGPIA